MAIAPYYFGCNREAGHFWWGLGMMKAEYAGPLGMEIDGVWAEGPEGQVTLVHVYKQGRWNSVLAWNDYSVDTRTGSNSAFVILGAQMTGEALLGIFEKSFPEVWQRQRKSLQIVRSLVIQEEEIKPRLPGQIP